ncbi:carboxymuconolactone decarboxylase family protein [Variovorax paradoxus]|nr:carboxymuconolactone decarboxylase family protein [Variovorax paradoxus]MBT2305234.1 carboxymuconolactone decarboxylase family protein [Variovorax paradoxus]
MARIEMPAADALTAEQAAACAEVVQGPRGKVPVPMIGWLSNPELAGRLQKLGALLRFDTSLSAVETELAILVCARHWTSHVEWKAHKALALKAGMDPAIPAAIAGRRHPELRGDRERVVYALATALLQTGRAAEPLYRTAVADLGERGVTEVIGLVGYYSLVSFTLNTFELGMPESAVPELEDPEFPGT